MNIADRRTSTVSSRDFNQDTAGAKRAASRGPVFITTRGRASHVLLTIEDYRRLEGKKPKSLLEAIADPSPEADFDFEIPEMKGTFKGFEFD